jgi:hypothetical protein
MGGGGDAGREGTFIFIKIGTTAGFDGDGTVDTGRDGSGGNSGSSGNSLISDALVGEQRRDRGSTSSASSWSSSANGLVIFI